MSALARLLLSLGVAGLLLWLLVEFGDLRPDEALATLLELPAGVLLVAGGLHLGLYVLRALRFKLLLPADVQPGYGRIFILSAAHNMASYVLPAKTGEASWVVYLKAHCGVRASTGLASLVVARLLDGAVLCSFVGVCCVLIGLSHEYDDARFMGQDSRVFLFLTAAVLLVLVLVLLALAARADWLIRPVTAFLRVCGMEKLNIGQRLIEKLHQIADALAQARHHTRLGLAALVSIPVWAGVFGFYFVLVRALGMDAAVSYPEVVFGSSLGVIANLLPANAFAGVGTQEAGWLLGFTLLGVSRPIAGSCALGVHMVQLFNVLFMGMVGHLGMGLMPARHAPTQASLHAEAEPPAGD